MLKGVVHPKIYFPDIFSRDTIAEVWQKVTSGCQASKRVKGVRKVDPFVHFTVHTESSWSLLTYVCLHRKSSSVFVPQNE